jgi:hypothetical protein
MECLRWKYFKENVIYCPKSTKFQFSIICDVCRGIERKREREKERGKRGIEGRGGRAIPSIILFIFSAVV